MITMWEAKPIPYAGKTYCAVNRLCEALGNGQSVWLMVDETDPIALAPVGAWPAPRRVQVGQLVVLIYDLLPASGNPEEWSRRVEKVTP